MSEKKSQDRNGIQAIKSAIGARTNSANGMKRRPRLKNPSADRARGATGRVTTTRAIVIEITVIETQPTTTSIRIKTAFGAEITSHARPVTTTREETAEMIQMAMGRDTVVTDAGALLADHVPIDLTDHKAIQVITKLENKN